MDLKPASLKKHPDLILNRRNKGELVTRYDGKALKVWAVGNPNACWCSGCPHMDKLRQDRLLCHARYYVAQTHPQPLFDQSSYCV